MSIGLKRSNSRTQQTCTMGEIGPPERSASRRKPKRAGVPTRDASSDLDGANSRDCHLEEPASSMLKLSGSNASKQAQKEAKWKRAYVAVQEAFYKVGNHSSWPWVAAMFDPSRGAKVGISRLTHMPKMSPVFPLPWKGYKRRHPHLGSRVLVSTC